MFTRSAESFRDKRILDQGDGIGRHAYYTAHSGAEVLAVDINDAIEVGELELASFSLTHLPFREDSFDLVYFDGRVATCAWP